MDRFIAIYYFVDKIEFLNLKSNMDRFIDKTTTTTVLNRKDLKSNMDRFIDFINLNACDNKIFKIQYG